MARSDYEIHLAEEFAADRMSRRELLRRASVAGISLAAFSPLLASCASSSAAGPSGSGSPSGPIKRGGTLRFASPIPSADPDPVTASNEGEELTYQPSVDYLCYPRSDWTLDPRLATTWKADPDPKTWRFTIRQGVKWQDGSPLTTDDVVASFERLVNPKVPSSAGSIYHGILSYGNVEKVSDTEVRFHLDTPFVDFPYLVSGFAYQSAVLPKNYELGTFSKGGIGTGPFILRQYIPQQSATYVANPHYWAEGLPYLSGLRVDYYGTEASTVVAMEAGNVDIYPVVPLKGAEAILASSKFNILRHPSADYRSIDMRVDKPPFNDKRVRQAFLSCIDRASLVKRLFSGGAQVANDHSWAPVYGFSSLPNKDIPQRTRDIAKAKALLAAAGHTSVNVTLTTENLLEMPDFAVALKNYCAPAGINISLNIMTSAAYYGSGSNQPWLAVPFGMTDWAARGAASQAIVPEFPSGAIWNESHWADPEFDKSFKAYNAELDNQRRNQLALKCARIQHEEAPYGIAYWIGAQRATAQNVHGLAPAPDVFIDLRAVWLS